MGTLLNREPVMFLSVINSGILLGIGFGAHITTEQMGLIMTFVGSVLALLARSKVISPDTLQTMTPETLAKAQSTSDPMKDTIRKLP